MKTVAHLELNGSTHPSPGYLFQHRSELRLFLSRHVHCTHTFLYYCQSLTCIKGVHVVLQAESLRFWHRGMAHG